MLFLMWSAKVHMDQCFSNGVLRNLRVPQVVPGVPPKQTEIAWDEIRSHNSMRL